MSIKLMAQVWELALDHPLQSVLLAMADHADDDGRRVFPSVPYLAWKTGYSERQVQRILAALEALSLIETVRYENGGRGRSTEYHLHLEKGDKKPPFQPAVRTPSGMSPFADPKGDNYVPKGDVQPQKGDIPSPNPDIALSPQPSITEKNHQYSSSRASLLSEVRNPRPPTPLPSSQYLAMLITDFSNELGDSTHLRENVNQALRLWSRTTLSQEAFGELCQIARARTRKQQSRPYNALMRNKMAYFFAVLRDLTSNPPAPTTNE